LVHASCLQRWLDTRPIALPRTRDGEVLTSLLCCEVCKSQYLVRIESRMDSSRLFSPRSCEAYFGNLQLPAQIVLILLFLTIVAGAECGSLLVTLCMLCTTPWLLWSAASPKERQILAVSHTVKCRHKFDKNYMNCRHQRLYACSIAAALFVMHLLLAGQSWAGWSGFGVHDDARPRRSPSSKLAMPHPYFTLLFVPLLIPVSWLPSTRYSFAGGVRKHTPPSSAPSSGMHAGPCGWCLVLCPASLRDVPLRRAQRFSLVAKER
jgi:hypothetical protein